MLRLHHLSTQSSWDNFGWANGEWGDQRHQEGLCVKKGVLLDCYHDNRSWQSHSRLPMVWSEDVCYLSQLTSIIVGRPLFDTDIHVDINVYACICIYSVQEMAHFLDIYGFAFEWLINEICYYSGYARVMIHLILKDSYYSGYARVIIHLIIKANFIQLIKKYFENFNNDIHFIHFIYMYPYTHISYTWHYLMYAYIHIYLSISFIYNPHFVNQSIMQSIEEKTLIQCRKIIN